MDPQDKKTKDYSILGQAEDRAISHAKYKREMGINPKYKTEQNVEVSRSAKSMKNPTQRPYDVKTSPVGLKKSEPRKAAGTVTEPYEPKRKAAGTYTEPYDIKKPAGKPPKAGSPVPKSKPTPEKAATDKSRLAPKMTNFQRMKARQFEKEGVAGRSMTAAQAKRKATEKGSSIADLRKMFGIGGQKKPEAKRSGPLKSAFAKISYQGRKK